MELEDNPEFARVLFGVPAPHKAIIGGKKYDIDTAEKVFDLPITAQDLGDITWEKTSLYRTRGGAFFLAGWGLEWSRWGQEVGGEEYPGSGIRPLPPEQVQVLFERHNQNALYEKYFGKVAEADGPGHGSNAAPRLIVFRSTKTVVLDDVQKNVSDINFSVLLLLAERALQSQGAKMSEIEKLRHGSVRETICVLKDALGKESANPKAIRAIVKNLRSWGYRLTLEPNDIDLRP